MCPRLKTVLISVNCLISINIVFSQNSNWEKLAFPQGIRVEQIAFNTKSDIFISTWWYPDSAVLDGNIDRIERSTDHGNSWQYVLNTGWQPITIAVDSVNNLFAGTWGSVFKSSNNGATWDTLVDTLPISAIHTVSLSPSGCIFIGANHSNFRSKDNGKHWELIPLQYQAEEFLFLKNGDILAGVNSGYFPNPPQYIYRSTDGGDSWQTVLNADKTYGWSLVASNNGTVFAATAEYDSSLGGVYRSTDSGVSWSRVNNGLPVREVNSLVIT
ncbi:MAG: YCF48-related protein [Bacteroidota bacterium]|jgi:photosystem II stability/assembly factor-like uncharacterized protein